MNPVKTAIIFQGSPRKNGNTAIVTQTLEAALTKLGWSIKNHLLYEMNFRGCAHCDACKKNKEQPACVLNDDLQPVLESIPQADAIVIASPIYCWSVSGCVSALLDRFYALLKSGQSLVEGKKMIGVFTSGGDAFDGMDLCVEMLKRYCDYAKAIYVDTFAVTGCESPEKSQKGSSLIKRAEVIAEQL